GPVQTMKNPFKMTEKHPRAGFLGLALFLLASSPASAQLVSSKGTDFWLGFPYCVQATTSSPQLIISSTVTTSGTVQIPGIGFTTPFTVTGGSTTTVTLPIGAMVPATLVDGTTQQGIHVTSLNNVTVYG